MKKPKHIAGPREASRVLGVPYKTVQEWTQHPHFPEKGPKGWTLEQFETFRAKYSRPRGRPPKDPEAPLPGDLPDYYAERAKKMAHSAELERLKVEQQRKELVPASEVERTWSQKNADLIQSVDRSFAKIAPKLSGLDAPAILKELRAMWRKVREESANTETV